MSDSNANPKLEWRVFAGVPDENAAYLMCAFLKAAGLHPVIERSDTLAHYGISPVNGCRVLLPDHEHGIALEAYAKVAVMPPGAAERAFESEQHERAPERDDLTDWQDSEFESDADSWKQGSAIEPASEFTMSGETVPDTGSDDPEDDDLPRESWSRRELLAEDAFDLSRVGLFGVLAMPHVCYLLLRVARSDERLRPSLRSKAIRAAWLSVPLFLLYFVVLPAIFIYAVIVR